MGLQKSRNARKLFIRKIRKNTRRKNTRRKNTRRKNKRIRIRQSGGKFNEEQEAEIRSIIPQDYNTEQVTFIMNNLNPVSDEILAHYDFNMFVTQLRNMINEKDFRNGRIRDEFLNWINGFGVYRDNGVNPYISDTETDQESSDDDY